MNGYEVGYKTGSGNVMSIRLFGELLCRSEIPVIDNVGDLCVAGVGCKGHNGGCPPYSPHFDRLKPSIDNVYVVVLEFDMAWAIKYSGWWKGVSAPGLYILVYADRLTMCYMQRCMKFFENTGYYTLGTSNCPGCRPKDCTVVAGSKCSKPEKRRYSVEATGIDCHSLHDQLFPTVLPWWFHTKEHMPASMYRYACVFTDKPASVMEDLLFDSFMEEDKSFCEDVHESLDYDLVWLAIPDGKRGCGHKYMAYRIPIELMGKSV